MYSEYGYELLRAGDGRGVLVCGPAAEHALNALQRAARGLLVHAAGLLAHVELARHRGGWGQVYRCTFCSNTSINDYGEDLRRPRGLTRET